MARDLGWMALCPPCLIVPKRLFAALDDPLLDCSCAHESLLPAVVIPGRSGM
jgi:hypothetical protein